MSLHATIIEASVSLGSLAVAGVVSSIDRIEQDIRIAALLAALAVSVLTAIKIYRDLRR